MAPCVYHAGMYTPKCLGNSDGLGRLEIFEAFFLQAPYEFYGVLSIYLLYFYFISFSFLIDPKSRNVCGILTGSDV